MFNISKLFSKNVIMTLALLIRVEQYGPADKSRAALVEYLYYKPQVLRTFMIKLKSLLAARSFNLCFQVLEVRQKET